MCMVMTPAISQCSTPVAKVSKTRVISIIDDDQDVRDALCALIRTLGYVALKFASAEEYLMSGLVRATSCLISDVRMPGMSGVDLQDRLLVDGYRIPIIFVTAVCNDVIRARALKAGALCFLTKPFDEKDLIECLDKALEGSR